MAVRCDLCEKELVATFIGLNINSIPNLTSYAQVGRKYTVAAFFKMKFIQKKTPQTVFELFNNDTLWTCYVFIRILLVADPTKKGH